MGKKCIREFTPIEVFESKEQFKACCKEWQERLFLTNWFIKYNLTTEEIKDEIQKTTDLIVKYVGVQPTFFRPPFISYNQLMYDNIDLTFIRGMGVEDWMPSVTAEERAKRMMDMAADGLIYLLHDMPGNEATVQAFDVVIPELKKQGYRFVTVPELFKAKNITPQRNKIYSNILTD